MKTYQGIKVCVLGGYRCGKTSLVQTLVDMQSRVVEDKDRTIGLYQSSYNSYREIFCSFFNGIARNIKPGEGTAIVWQSRMSCSSPVLRTVCTNEDPKPFGLALMRINFEFLH